MVLRLFIFLCIAAICAAEKHNRYFVYGKKNDITALLESSLYKRAVEQLPICCVDIFVYNPHDKSYFLVLRKSEPAQGVWWYPGGRLFKGETFFECARRKCKEEIGLTIKPVTVLGVYATTFDTSAWDCPTQTINSVVYATIDSSMVPKIDRNHTGYRWVPIDEVPDDPYVYQVYCDIRAALKI